MPPDLIYKKHEAVCEKPPTLKKVFPFPFENHAAKEEHQCHVYVSTSLTKYELFYRPRLKEGGCSINII